VLEGAEVVDDLVVVATVLVAVVVAVPGTHWLYPVLRINIMFE
jgi:hypothetical protein